MTNATLLLFPGFRVHEIPLPDVEPVRARRRSPYAVALAFGIRAALSTFIGIAISVLAWKIGTTLFALGFVAAIGAP